MEPEVQFVGVRIPPKETVAVDERLEEGLYISTLHITQFALAENPKGGRNTIAVKTAHGERFVLGTLEKDRCEQFQADFMLPGELEVTNSGDTEVHLTGYKTITSLNDMVPDDLPSEASLSEDDEDFEDEIAKQDLQREWKRQALKQMREADANGAPAVSPAQRQALGQATVGELEGRARRGNGVPDLPSEEEELADYDTSDDGGPYGEDTSDEEDSSVMASSEGDSGESEGEDDSDTELKAASLTADAMKAQPQNGKKRDNDGLATKPAKKFKTDAKVQPVQGLSASGTADSEWEAAIFQHISTAGPVKLGGLGSVVKKPAGVTKKLKQLVIESKRLSLGQGDEVKLA